MIAILNGSRPSGPSLIILIADKAADPPGWLRFGAIAGFVLGIGSFLAGGYVFLRIL